MNKSRRFTFIVLILLISIIASTGCNVKLVQQGKTPSSIVSDATLSTEIDSQSKPVNPANSFTVTAEKIYLSVKLNNAPANTQVMAKLTYLNGEVPSLANSSMFNSSLSGEGNGYLAFAMKAPPGGFPQGSYQVALSANGQDITSIPFTIQNLAAQKGWPVVSKFTASQDTIAAGQSVTLSWDVTNATRISLQPEIGTINASGTRSVTPSVSTTYKLIASNDAGATTREITVNVGAAISGSPDLIITDAWLEGCMIYYKIKNIGSQDSPATTTYIYVNNLLPTMGWSSFVDILKPGQEKTMVFSSYQWPWCGSDSGAAGGGGGVSVSIGSPSHIAALAPSHSVSVGPMGVVDWSLLNHTVKVCADSKNEAVESNKNNNCIVKIWGILLDYDLLPLSHLAGWKNSSGNVPAFGTDSSASGAYIKMGDGGLEMVPEQVPQGWIQGYWGYFYTDTDTRTPQTAYIKLPARTHFVATVGLGPDATGSDGVTYKLGLRDMSDTMNFLPGKKMTVPGQYETWDVDLSDYEGQSVLFVLRVEAGASAAKDFAIWKTAKLIQVP
ncbi:MAG: hypothetical protein EHM12_02095 [Dehalococcoidia bacterium]|nr:MAG: hypothetical protein EHM12_02095 [Dehalococcoidia bacterium]